MCYFSPTLCFLFLSFSCILHPAVSVIFIKGKSDPRLCPPYSTFGVKSNCFHKTSAITCFHPATPVSSSIAFLRAPYFSQIEVLVGAQTGQILECGSTSRPPKICCPSDSAQTLPEEMSPGYPLGPPSSPAVQQGPQQLTQHPPRPCQQSHLHAALQLLADVILI